MSVGELTKLRFIIVSRARPERFEALGDPLPVNEWVHLVGVWDGTKIHIYVNGELQNSADAVGQPWDSPEAVYIGADEGCNAVREGVISVASLMKLLSLMYPSPRTKLSRSAVELKVFLRSMLQAKPLPTTWGKLKSAR